MQNKVNLFIVGINKSGTTWLYHLLKSHSNITFSDIKELDYFNNDYPDRIDNYHKYFDFEKNTKYFAEGSPSYIRKAQTAKNIFEYNPDSKIIIMLRDPIIRLLSQFYFRKQIGKIPENLKLQEAIHGGDPFIISDSHYEKFLPYWTELFPSENIKIMSMEKGLSEKYVFWADILDFLNLEISELPEIIKKSKNITGSKKFRLLYKFTILPIKRKLPTLYQFLLQSNFMKKAKKEFLNKFGKQKKEINAQNLDYLKIEFESTYQYLYDIGLKNTYSKIFSDLKENLIT